MFGNFVVRVHKLAIVAFLMLVFCDFFDRTQYIDSMPKLAAATYIVATLRYIALGFLLFIFYKKNKQIKSEFPKIAYYVFLLWSVWCLITLIRGIFLAGDYWDWKFLLTENVLRYSIHFSIIAGIYLVIFRDLFSLIVKKLFFFSFVFLYFSSGSFDYLFSYMVMPITLIMLAFPFVQKRDQLIILLVAFCSLVFALDFRANAIRLVFCFALILIFYFRKFVTHSVLKMAVIVMMILPIVIFYLGVTGQYNPFSQLSKVEATKHYASGEEENLTADTRTFLYVETLQTLQSRKSFLIGEGGAGAYDSVYNFEYLIDARRYSTEVGFLNVILNAGVVGVILYFLILLIASYYGVWKSNNWFSKMIGLAVAFRWVTFFIEDPVAFNMNIFFLWLAIGLSFSKTVRAMSDYQITKLFQLNVRKYLA